MRIAIIDDDQALLESLSVILAEEGHRIEVLKTTKEALAYFATPRGTDLLILDYLLPDGNGCELLAVIRDRLPEGCRVIMTSGHTDLLDFSRLSRLGVEAFLPKPIDLDRLFVLLDDQLARIAAQSGGKFYADG